MKNTHKKIRLLAIYSCLFFLALFSTDAIAEESIHNKYFELNVTVGDSWVPVSRTDRIYRFLYKDKVSSLNVRVIQFAERYPTANGIQIQRAGSVYDGWLNILEREGTSKETKKSNTEESYIAVYNKKQLNKQLKIEKTLVAEYCYVKQKRAYILTFQTQMELWGEIKEEVKEIVASFWVGEKDRPRVNQEVDYNIEWKMSGVNSSNQNYLETKLPLFREMNKIWDLLYESKERYRKVHISPVATEENIFFTHVDRIYSVSLKTGEERWNFKIDNIVRKNLLYGQDIFYFIKGGVPNQVYGVMANSGNLLFKHKLSSSEISDPIMVNNNL